MNSATYTVFEGVNLIITGSLEEAAAGAKRATDKAAAPILVFDDTTGEVVDLDYRGTVEDVVTRIAARNNEDKESLPRGPGRPKIGVTAREITLLPRHWEWLKRQPGGASAAIRRMVEEASRRSAPRDHQRAARDALYKFMVTIAGDAPGFEEASRALFANDSAKMQRQIENWPAGIKTHIEKFIPEVFAEAGA